MLRPFALIASVALFLTGCAAPQHQPFPEADVPGMAPPPYTANEIRDHHADGSYVVMVTMDGEGNTLTRQRTTFLEPDATEVTIELHNLDEAGEAIGESVGGGRGTWASLRTHAHFPAAQTVLSHSEVSTPAGTYACWCYTVTSTTAAGGVAENVFHFAVGEPGPPVLMVVRVDGVEVQRMTMVEDGRG